MSFMDAPRHHGVKLHTAQCPPVIAPYADFYVNPTGYRHAHGVWRLFVLGGTASHYAAIAGFVP